MRKWIKIILVSLLVAGGAVVCAVRWQAWFGMPAEPHWTGDTIDYVFPEPNFSDSVDTLYSEVNLGVVCQRSGLTIMVLGDVHNRLQREDYDTLAARVPNVDLVAQTGDWMDRGQGYYHQLLLREWTNSALFGTPVIVCPGNHEYSKGLSGTLSPVWSEAFPHPDNGPKAVPGASYFVDVPYARFIILDTNPLKRLVYLTRTLTWLRQAMYSAGDRYIVIMMHHPVLSVAKGRFNSLIYATFRYALSQADLVLAGHDHSYMRRTPFVVLNTAGKPKTQHMLYTPEVTDTEPVYGVIQLNHDDGLQFKAYRLSDGFAIDSLYVKHD